MKYNNLVLQINQGVALLTIERPSKLNALNKETIQELHWAFRDLNSDPSVSVIILTGSGEKAFVAGADIKEFADFNVEQGKELSGHGQELLFDFVENLSTPVIAAINGFALGGGLELAMSCHFRVASTNAKMGLPEVSLGVIPGYGGTQRLPQLIGKGRAMEMIMTAGMIDANQALSFGLVNHVKPQEQLLLFCDELARKILKNSSTAISAAIHCVNSNYKHDVDGYKAEIKAFGECFGTEDFVEGTSAFLEKRKVKFSGK